MHGSIAYFGRKLLLALAFVLFFLVSEGVALCDNAITEKQIADLNAYEMDAIFLAQGSSKNGLLDETLISELVAALKAVQSQYPDMQDIIVGARDRYRFIFSNGLVLTLTDSARSIVDSKAVESPILPPSFAIGHYRYLLSTGIAELDRLNTLYRADTIEVNTSSSSRYVAVRWQKRPVDLLSLIPIYEKIDGVDYLGLYRVSRTTDLPANPFGRTKKALPSFLSEYFYTSDGNQIVFIPKDPVWHFVLKRGKGDCPAGCTENHFFYFTYDRKSRKVTMEGQLRPGDITDGTYLWGVPIRHHFYTFDSYDKLALSVRSNAWWVRVHAVDVLGFILAGAKSSRFGEDKKSQTDFLIEEVLKNRRAGFRLLIESLNDTDEDVKAVAHQHLIEATGKDYGRGAPVAVENWLNWLAAEQP